jgi:serine O-acetyltransferase
VAATLRRDIRAARERDPAARSDLEVVLSYPGVHALWMHRVAHALHGAGLRLPARLVSQVSRGVTGIEIHPGATLGPGLFIDHGMGVVIGETTVVGANVTIYQGVTLGGTGKQGGKRHPTVGDDVVIGTAAQVLGPLTIGAGAKVGAGAIVVKDVPADSTVVGNPGRPVVLAGRRVDGHREPDIEHTRLPDPVAEALARLVARVGQLEAELAALREGREAPPPAEDGGAAASIQEEISRILGLNGNGGTTPARSAEGGAEPGSTPVG